MYISLYRRYRPQSFSDVVGQSAAVGVVTRAVENGSVGHAYLFSGPRGCGKTTIARLFAKAVNCPHRKGAEPCNECETCRSIVEGSCLDVIEIDGASNNSVDEIRDLKEHVALASFSCACKVYIIDEVHMLTMSAFNALLKTLEEPPERVMFILATTAPHKVPVTIRSRCQHIPFHGMTTEQIVERLAHISELEKIQAQEEALWEIARNSEGGMRDALSLMEQAIALSGGDVTREAVDKLLGGGSSSSIRQWISCCRTSPEEALPKLEAMFRSGAVPERFLSMLFVCVRNLWLDSRWGDKVLNKLALSQEEKQWLSTERGFLPQSSLERLMTQIASALPHVRRGLSNDVLCGLLTEWFFQGTAPSPDAFSALEAARESGFVLAPSVSKASSAAPRRAEPEDSSEISAPLPAQPEKIVPPASVFGDLAGAPEAAARGSFAQELDASCEKYPQAAVALRLADVFIDAEKSAVCALFSEEERMAFESLRNDRAIESARRVFLKVLPEVAAVELRCGNDREVFDSFLPEESGSVSESAPNGQTAAPSKEPLVHPRRARFDPETFVPEITSQPAEAEKTAEVKNQPLAEYVRGFMEGELLYCRPNGQPDSGEEEQQS